MTIKVYAISGAPRPWRVLLGLVFKELAFETVWLNGSQREHKSAAFLTLNPRGTVPVVEANGVRLRDSIATLAWLDRAYPDRPLFGVDDAHAAHIWQATLEMADYLRTAQHAVLSPVIFDGVTEATPDLLSAAQTLKAEIAGLEAMLADGRHYLCGDRPSAADAVAFPEIRLFMRVRDSKSTAMTSLGLAGILEASPGIGAWVARIESWPDYERTSPPHWRDAA